MYGVCSLSIIPCRKEPSGASEMLTQLLFGEHFYVLEITESGWAKIKTAYDNYECWISEKQLTAISHKTFEGLERAEQILSNEFIGIIQNLKSNLFSPILIGSVLPNYENGKIKIEKEEFKFDGQVLKTGIKTNAKALIECAKQFLDAPYLWGGRSVFGIDCSGFTQLVYKLNGIKLPRDSNQQVHLGRTLNFVEEAQPGDIAFFDNEEGKIIHVGIILENQNIIHASGKVRIDKLDHQGIFNEEKRKYSHNLRVIKSLDVF